MTKINKTQDFILNSLSKGAVLQCSEGKNFKTWLRFEDGTKKTIRRDQSDKFCAENNVEYGDSKGGAFTEVRLKKTQP